jgi:hypothetical protein
MKPPRSATIVSADVGARVGAAVGAGAVASGSGVHAVAAHAMHAATNTSNLLPIEMPSQRLAIQDPPRC